MVKQRSVVDAVRADVEALGALPAGSAALVATAAALAGEIDSSENSATSKAACAKSLGETMDRLRELAPQARVGDRLDDLSERRSSRRAAAK